jgi:hypothetical protein
MYSLTSDVSGLVQLNDCTCLGHTQTFECNVCGVGSTVWSGTFFVCENGIKLRHSRYNNIVNDTDPESVGPPNGKCNQGTVVAKSIGVFDDCYTSQLIVTVGEEMINGTIECIHDNFIERTIVNQKSLMITETPFPPPTNIHIESNHDPHQITFAWDKVTVQCPSLQYIITAMNCGLCPNTTADKNVTCDTQSHDHISPRTNNTCLFAVQTEICGHLRGRRSEYVRVHFSKNCINKKFNNNVCSPGSNNNIIMIRIRTNSRPSKIQTELSLLLKEYHSRDNICSKLEYRITTGMCISYCNTLSI